MTKQSPTVRYMAIGARVLLGLMFFIFGFGYFFMAKMAPDLSTPGGQYFGALLATGYFVPFLKVMEGIAGLMLFFKRWTPLSLLILAPIIIQIMLYDLFLDTAGLLMGVVCLVLGIFLAWYNWEKYAPLFKKA